MTRGSLLVGVAVAAGLELIALLAVVIAWDIVR